MLEVSYFAGGCFWCLQKDFDHTPGVLSTQVGYMGGNKENPSYEEICTGTTGHLETIEVSYDTSKTLYKDLLKVYFASIQVKRTDGQFCDIGPQYRAAIFYKDEQEKQQALILIKKLEAKTLLLPKQVFYPAEPYHQKYYQKEPLRYRSYFENSGRSISIKHNHGDEIGD